MNIQLNDISTSLGTSIRLKIEKRGITIYKNAYTGYDSEYQEIDGHNKLISVQLAVSGSWGPPAMPKFFFFVTNLS